MRIKQKTSMALLGGFVFLLASCGGGGSGGGGSSSSSSGGAAAPQTFSVEVNAVTISRLDNDEAITTEGSTGNGATVTLDE